ncbi:hypothetical protein Rhopal_006785-T1 [Rhodotorula paludigena]|uniref:Rho-GAP domain-containing protein n=1 Tax=Rhodotorula paludigena TaxID=86838 RepID=A0AAV5GZ04_9BASI|nr:hypothetical protein Rhopal_006785-T1 [Rhodotorula paludigena]
MPLLSRFSSYRGKASRPSTSAAPPDTAQRDLLPLSLPTSSLLADASLANPLLLANPHPSTSSSAQAGPSAYVDSDLRSLRSVDTTPWVEVRPGDASSATPRSTRTLRPRTARPPAALDRARERRERERLERARFGPAELALLLAECGGVIRARGLDTLGLFRPYRASESRDEIRKLCGGFCDWAEEERRGARGDEASKAVLLHAFREELRYANVHDVVAVLKWGLRHFAYPPGTSFSGSHPPSLDWFYTFLRRSASLSPSPHASHAFSAFLLPSLPPSSQTLLLSTLTLAQSVVAHAQQNAMPASRLSRLFGLYLFGPSPSGSIGSGVDALHEQWRAAGLAFEGCLKAFLRAQSDLPPRLAELAYDEAYAAWVARALAGEHETAERTVRVLRVELESRGEWDAAVGEPGAAVNDQQTGLVPTSSTSLATLASGASPGPVRRKPLEILLAAVHEGALDETVGAQEDEEAARAWRTLVEQARRAEEGVAGALLDDEVMRVLDMLGLVPAPATAGTGGEEEALAPLDFGAHARSHSEQQAAQRRLSNFPNKSLAHLPASPSSAAWEDFASTGFSSSHRPSEFGLDTKDQFLQRADSLAARQGRARIEPTTRLVSVAVVELADDFSDLWLDSLDETSSPLAPAAGWPSIVLAPLKRDLVSHLSSVAQQGDRDKKLDHLFLAESLLPPAAADLLTPASSFGLNRALSTSSSTAAAGVHRRPRRSASGSQAQEGAGEAGLSRKWRRRASAIFGPSSTTAEDAPSTSSNGGLSTLLPTARRSRKSLGDASSSSRPRTSGGLAPPVPPVPPVPSTLPTIPSSPSSKSGFSVRNFSQGIARRRSRASMYGAPTATSSGPGASENETPVPPLPDRYAALVLNGGREQEAAYASAEEGGYHVDSRQGSPEVARGDSTADDGRFAALQPPSPNVAAQEEQGGGEAKAGPPLALGGVLVPSPVMEEAEFEPAGQPGASGTDEATMGVPNGDADAANVRVSQIPLVAATPIESPLDPATPLYPPAIPAPDEFVYVGQTASSAADDIVGSTDGAGRGAQVDRPLAGAGLTQLEHAVEGDADDAAPLEPKSSLPADDSGPPNPPVPEKPEAADLSAPEEAQGLVVPPVQLAEEDTTIEPATPKSPLVTLSPPQEEKELPDVPDQGSVAAMKQEKEEAELDVPAAPLGLGLLGADETDALSHGPASAPPATPSKDDPRVAPSTPRALASPTLSSGEALSPTLSQASRASQSSLGVPKSPTPSSSSGGSRKFLSNVGGFLKRRKSNAADKEQARREKEDAKREKEEQKQLRKLKEDELRREKKERRIPTPVSNVKARVREIEEEAKGIAAPSSPSTPTRIRTTSASSPPPISPRSLSRPGSVSSLRRLPPKPIVPPPSDPLPPLPVESITSNASPPLAASAATSGETGANTAPAVVSPAQESQHLHVKTPAPLDELPSPIPSPTPLAGERGDAPLLVAASEDDVTETLPSLRPPTFGATAPERYELADAAEEHAAVLPSLNVTSPVPAQTPEHLHVKVPSALEDLPSPAPSPTPGAETGAEPLVDDLTETIPEIHAPVFSAPTAGFTERPLGETPASLEDKSGEGEEPVPAAVSASEASLPESAVVPSLDEAVSSLQQETGELVNGHDADSSDVAVAAPANEPPSTPVKLPASTKSTPASHSTPSVPVSGDVFSTQPPSTPVVIEATPTKPPPPARPVTPPAITHVVRPSPSVHSISTTTSFQTADSSAQSTGTTERWEAPDDTF